MRLTKDGHILRSLSKIKHKKWELYIVSRIFHLLDDLEIEFVCQQQVRRPNGIALTDMYFPQFGIHLEIDEQHHGSEEAIKLDQDRTKDIIDATKHTVQRIRVYSTTESRKNGSLKSLIDLNKEVDGFVEMIREKKRNKLSTQEFSPWDHEGKYSAQPHIDRGCLDVENNPIFKYQRDALKCFGYKGGNYQRGSWRLKSDKNRMAWFPRLYETKKWNNSLSDDGETIKEINRASKAANSSQKPAPSSQQSRIVFARYKNELGNVLYRFLGEFKYDEKSSEPSIAIYNRVKTRVELP